MAVLTGTFTFNCESAQEYAQLLDEVTASVEKGADDNGNRLLTPAEKGSLSFTVEYRNEVFTQEKLTTDTVDR